MLNKINATITTIAGLIIVCALFGSNIFQNSLGLLFQGNYFIPEQSNIFTFKVLQSAEGSGEGWLYAKDWSNYYAIDVGSSNSYIFASKIINKGCPSFDALNYKTWCSSTFSKLPF
jgi:hypothetical protein